MRVASPGIVVLLDKRGLTEADDSGVIDYARLLNEPVGDVADPRQSRAAAFIFPSVDWQPDLQLSHAVLLSDAR
ncbi:hypothetical protein ALO43_200496 [Pseudomonas tremae]|uniref:Restriction endonuclease Eco57I n=1 Tax=Pseudomonas tremae TaxID=200454 RepID=A0AA40P3L9_9PSED|nr:hypothetical protein ALO43_200496 [Pseudomonas tremae]